MRTYKRNRLQNLAACAAYNEVLAFILIDPFQEFLTRCIAGGDMCVYGDHWTYNDFKEFWNPDLFPNDRFEEILTPEGFTEKSWGPSRGRYCFLDELD